MDDEPSLAEELVMALGIALVRKGVLDAADLAAAGEGQSEEVAHLLQCMAIEAAAPSQSQWQAEQARSRFRVVTNPDGGKG